MVIEFVGLPRSGKTTLINSFFGSCYHIHEEAFDKVPYKERKYHQFNLWYAQYIATEIQNVKNSAGKHVFDRGPYDRTVFAEVAYECGLISKDERDQQREVLQSCLQLVDLVVFCDVSVQESLSRDTTPNETTSNQKFLYLLKTNYEKIGSPTKVVKIPTNKSVEESVRNLKYSLCQI